MKLVPALVLCAFASVGADGSQRAPKPTAKPPADTITVYRTATCGCCGKWVEHLKNAGFPVTVNIVRTVDDIPQRDRIPPLLQSCHTAKVAGYFVEGHVPPDDVKKLLKERPKIAGIAVPGMPAGSPGMESPYPERYNVIAFDANGKTSVFAKR